jgi:hypothetical protein
VLLGAATLVLGCTFVICKRRRYGAKKDAEKDEKEIHDADVNFMNRRKISDTKVYTRPLVKKDRNPDFNTCRLKSKTLRKLTSYVSGSMNYLNLRQLCM